MPAPINMVKDGRTITVSDPNEIATAYHQGWQPETPTQHVEDVGADVQAERYGGPVGKFAAVGTGALRTVTGGLSDVAGAALGGREVLSGLREENPIASTVGELAGAALPVGTAALAGRAGAAVSALGEGAGIAGRIGASAAGGAATGAIFGAGQGVSEVSLSSDPLTVEHVAAAIGSNALYGAGLGGAIGGAGKALAIGLGKAKGAIDTALERRAAKAKTPAQAIESGDLQYLDKPMLDAAEKGEIARIAKEQAPQRNALVDELGEYRKANRDAHAMREVVSGAAEADVREAGATFVRNDRRLRTLLDDRVGLAEDPLAAKVLLRKQTQALETIGEWAKTQEQLWKQDLADAPAKIRSEVVNKLVPDYLGPFTPRGLDLVVERVLKERQGLQWGGAIRGGLKEPAAVRLRPQYNQVLEQNRRFAETLERLAKPPESPLLTKIGEARAVLEAPKEPSLMQAGLNVVAPFAGPLGVAAAAGNRVIGGLGKLAAAATTRAGKAASTFLGVAEKATAKVTPYAPALATKTLAAVSYASERPRAVERTLPALYKARTAEIKEQVHIAPDGSYQMRPEARQRMAATFDGIRAADPHLADKLETAGARRIAYLASIMPRLPDYGTVQIGPERREIPDMQMRSWARSVAAVEDPEAVFEGAAAGMVTPQAVAAVRAVWPAKLGDFTRQILEGLPARKTNLPRKQRLALSILTGVPIDPAMTPGVLRVIQGMYASEPGTKGGTQAPTPQPAFGSVKADPGTKAQQRIGENA